MGCIELFQFQPVIKKIVGMDVTFGSIWPNYHPPLYRYYTFVFYNSNQDEKYKKMTGGLKNTIARNYQANDTDYVYIDCFGR